MARHQVVAPLVLWLAVRLVAGTVPASACGPYPFDTRFWFDHRPGVAEHRAVRGELGVFAPEYDTAWIFTAWRQLTAPGLVESDREKLVWLLVDDDEPKPNATEVWAEARKAVLGEDLGWLDTSREASSGEDGTRTWEWFENCLPDAFATAAMTLSARVASYGADDPAVREWLRGQDAVFDNCDGGVIEPAAASGDAASRWPEWLRHDRAYQLAAAALYSERYDEAGERFEAIAQDPDSPWRTVSAYLVARSLARAGRNEDAIARFRRVLDDPAAAEYHASARGLVDHLLFRHDPEALRREVTARLAAAPLPKSLAQDLVDFRQLAVEHAFEGGEIDPLTDWFRAVKGWTAPQEVVERWRRERGGPHGTAWRWAALLRANATEVVFDDGREYPALPAAVIEELLSAETLEPGATGAVSEAYHRARLLIDLGRPAEAALILERGIEGWYGSVAISDTNLFLAQRLRAATSVDEIVRFGKMHPEEVGWNYGGREPLDPPEGALPTWDGGALWHYAAATAFNGLEPSALAARVTQGSVDDALLVAETLRTAWTRAAVLGDRDATVELARRLAEADPTFAPALAGLGSASGVELPFAAALVLLHHPGMHPDVHWGVSRTSPLDELESGALNWWCEGTGFDLPDAETRTRLGLGDEAAGRLEQLPSAPNWLGDVILAYADGHPDDPRVPEALHQVVRATRYGCAWGERSVAEVSKGAFDRLHQRYPKSPWTEKTPYWFD